MRLVRPFDPVAVGEVADLGFDFLLDAGSAYIVSGSFICTLAPYQTQIDPNPQARVLSTSVENTIVVRSPVDGSAQRRRGAYVVARMGGFPDTAVGGVYLLGAQASMSDGRVLSLSSTVLCAATA